MYKVRKVVGPVGTYYHVIQAVTYEWYGKYETVEEAYLKAKELNDIYHKRV